MDTTYADLDISRCKNVVMKGNSFHAVTTRVENVAEIEHNQSTPSDTWVIDTAGHLPFDGHALNSDAVVAHGAIRNANNVAQYDMPYVKHAEGPDSDQLHVIWPTPVKGKVSVMVRMDSR